MKQELLTPSLMITKSDHFYIFRAQNKLFNCHGHIRGDFVVVLSQFSPEAEANVKAITVAQSLDILLLLISRTLAHSWCAEGLLGGPSSSDH